MKPSIPFTRTYKDADAVRWFVIGAYQAGASEPEIVALTNLSKRTVGYIIGCFKRTGMPNVRRRKRTNQQIEQGTMIDAKDSHYDASSELEEDYSDSSSDDQYHMDNDGALGIKKEEQDEKHLAWKEALYFRRKCNSRATDTIDYVLYKGRKHEEKRISSWQKTQKRLQNDQQKQIGNCDQYDMCPPSPPHLNNLLIPKSEPSHASSTTNPPSPPPLSSHQLCIPSVYSLVNTISTNTSRPSSPSSSDMHQHMDEYLNFSIPSSSSSTTSSPTSSPTLQPVLSQDYHENHRYGNLPHRFKFWSRGDDKVLLFYVLTRMRCWDELDRVFDGRHSALDCRERWDLLQHYLFKELKKTGTYSW